MTPRIGPIISLGRPLFGSAEAVVALGWDYFLNALNVLRACVGASELHENTNRPIKQLPLLGSRGNKAW